MVSLCAVLVREKESFCCLKGSFIIAMLSSWLNFFKKACLFCGLNKLFNSSLFIIFVITVPIAREVRVKTWHCWCLLCASQGFQWLVEREWLAFGHKFADRCGHTVAADDPNERAPVFLQWLDCVFQVTQQFPCAFQFNEAFLVSELYAFSFQDCVCGLLLLDVLDFFFFHFLYFLYWFLVGYPLFSYQCFVVFLVLLYFYQLLIDRFCYFKDLIIFF